MSNLDEFSETPNQPKKHSRAVAEIKRCWSQALFGYDCPEGFFNNPIYKIIATPVKLPEILFRFLYSALTALIGTSIAAKVALSPLLLIGRLIMMITSPLRSLFAPGFEMWISLMRTKNPVKKIFLGLLMVSLTVFNVYIITAALTFCLLSVGIIPLASVATVGGVFTMALTPTYLAVTSFFATLMPLLAAPAVGVIVALASFAITALIAQKLCQYIVNLATHTYKGQGVKAGLWFVVSSLGKLIGEEEGLVKTEGQLGNNFYINDGYGVIPARMHAEVIDLVKQAIKHPKENTHLSIDIAYSVNVRGKFIGTRTLTYQLNLTKDGSEVLLVPLARAGNLSTYKIEGLNTDNPFITTKERPANTSPGDGFESANNFQQPGAQPPLPQARWTLAQVVTQCLNFSETMGSISLAAHEVPDGLSPGIYSLNNAGDFTDASKDQYELCYKTEAEVSAAGHDGSKIKITKQADGAYGIVAEDAADDNNLTPSA